MSEPLLQPVFGPPWSGEIISWSDTRGQVVLRRDGKKTATVELERCASGRLRLSYPVGARDIEVRVLELSNSAEITTALQAVVAAIRKIEPQCRKVVYVVDADIAHMGTAANLATIAAAEGAGFRYVLDVDVAQAELSLLVSEPEWLVDVDIDLVPGS